MRREPHGSSRRGDGLLGVARFERLDPLIDRKMRVVSVCIDDALSGFAGGALIVYLGGHTLAAIIDAVKPTLHVRQAFAVTVERVGDPIDRLTDGLHGVTHGIDVVSDVRRVVIADLRVGGLGGGLRLLSGAGRPLQVRLHACLQASEADGGGAAQTGDQDGDQTVEGLNDLRV